MGDLLDLLDDTMKEKLGLERLLFYARIPVDRHIIKKNRRPIFRNTRTGQPFIGKSSELKSSESYLLLQLRSLKNKYGIIEPIKGALHCMLLFTHKNMYTARGSISRGVGDLSNLLELPCDCLQEAGIIENDAQIHSFDFSRRLSGEENILEIFLMDFKERIDRSS